MRPRMHEEAVHADESPHLDDVVHSYQAVHVDDDEAVRMN